VTNMAHMFSGASAMSDCSKAHIGHSDGFGPLSEKAAWGNIAIAVCYAPQTDATFKQAFKEYLADTAAASAKYGPIEGWDVSQVTKMDSLFVSDGYAAHPGAATFNADISNWNTEAVYDMSFMFNYATSFDQPIGSWKTGAVTTMKGMFIYASSFNQRIGDWNTEAVTTMYAMFYHATSFDQPIGDWNTGAVTDMRYMFYRASAMSDCSKAHIGHSAGFPVYKAACGYKGERCGVAWGNIAICAE